jgi:hypothetical protein
MNENSKIKDIEYMEDSDYIEYLIEKEHYERELIDPTTGKIMIPKTEENEEDLLYEKKVNELHYTFLDL